MKTSAVLSFRIFFFLLLLSFGTEREMHAYTDPGTGTLLWQLLLASVSGGAFYCYKAVAWLKNRKNPKN